MHSAAGQLTNGCIQPRGCM